MRWYNSINIINTTHHKGISIVIQAISSNSIEFEETNGAARSIAVIIHTASSICISIKLELSFRTEQQFEQSLHPLNRHWRVGVAAEAGHGDMDKDGWKFKT